MSQSKLQFQTFTDKNISPREIAELVISVGWDNAANPDINLNDKLYATHLEKSSLVVYAKESSNRLIGYASVLSDGVFTAFVDLIVVHPDFQRKGVGTSLLTQAQQCLKGVPFYAMPFQDMHEFFIKNGFKIQKTRPMQAVSKRNPYDYIGRAGSNTSLVKN